jgi:hypothetical protein
MLSQRAIHVHASEMKHHQLQANTELQEVYLFPQQCDWGTTCNTIFEEDFRDACAHMRSHIDKLFSHKGLRSNCCGLSDCEEVYVCLISLFLVIYYVNSLHHHLEG